MSKAEDNIISQDLLKSQCPSVLQTSTYQDLLDKTVENELKNRFSTPGNKYQKAMLDPQNAGFFTEDLIRMLRPNSEKDYFSAVIANNGFGGTYQQYKRYKAKTMELAKSVAFGKYFIKSALDYEADLREKITPDDMRDYLSQKLRTHIKNDLLGCFSSYIDKSIGLFGKDSEKLPKYVKVMALAKMLDITISTGKHEKFAEALYLAIDQGIPLVFFLPQCLRYYYDESGEQQIIENLDSFEYTTMCGNPAIKKNTDLFREIECSLIFPTALFQIGLPVEIIVPVMDHELLRPKIMNTEENHRKVQAYISQIANYYQNISRLLGIPISVQSSVGIFGIPQESKEFKEITSQVNTRDGGRFRIKNQTFMHAVDEEHKRNTQDLERNKYYQSREFAALCRRFDVGEGYYHAVKMSEYSRDGQYAGVLTKMPKGAEFDTQIFNLDAELIAYQA